MRRPTPLELDGLRVWRIPLTQGKSALVSDGHLGLVSEHTWFADRHSNTFYAYTHLRLPDGSSTKRYMHQMIGEALGIVGLVDHKSRDGLDNRESNLRPSSPELNGANQRNKVTYAGVPVSSPYKGVSWKRSHRKWLASLRSAGKQKFLGYFDAAVDAARAYDKEALAVWGEYAKLNFPVDLALQGVT